MTATFFITPQSNDRLAQLWEDLPADPVPPLPAAKGPVTAGRRFAMTIVYSRAVSADHPYGSKRRGTRRSAARHQRNASA